MKLTANAPHSVPGPEDIFRKVLPNGITVLTRSNFNSASVVISGLVSAGSQLDPLEKLGLAYFTSLGLMRGTQQFDFQTIFDRLESAGASLGFGASVHNTSFGGRGLVEDLPMLLFMLSDSLRNPVFPEAHLERVRSQLLTSMAIRAQDTGDMAAMEFDALLFPDHPYGRPEDGFVETIQSITRSDIVKFHQENYGPANMVVVVVGAVQPQQVFEMIEANFGDWQPLVVSQAPNLSVIHPPKETFRRHVNIPGKSQSDLVIGTLGPKRNAPEYLAASLGNSILGQFGMMGRIGDSVREKAGLAYYASTSLNAWIENGSWEVSAGVNPENLGKATDLIIQELRRFTSEPVSMEELEDNQSNYIGRMPLSLESNNGVANTILNLERFSLGLDYLQRYPELIHKITPQQILEAARKYIDPDRLVIVSAGSDHKNKESG